MTEERLVSFHDIMQELDAGTAATRFILKRFHHRFVVETNQDRPRYREKDLKQMLWIKQSLASGMLPSAIEKKLDTDPDLLAMKPGSDFSETNHSFSEQNDGRISIGKDGLDLIQSVFSDMGDHQKKLALAHEKRAAAEERKAAAIEKRAAAEEKKAMAMHDIAAALQQMTRQGSQDPALQDVTHEAVKAIQMDDDLTQLLDTPLPEGNDLDDLGALVDAASSDPATPDHPSENGPAARSQQENQDWQEAQDRQKDFQEKSAAAEQMDDLRLLLTNGPEETRPLEDDIVPLDMDDLSLLVTSSHTDDLDDLAALLDSEPTLKPDISREQDLKKYKAAVMKIIMDLKSQGMDAGKTAHRLNQDKVETISGKPEWTVKAITQIYSFIDAAAG